MSAWLQWLKRKRRTDTQRLEYMAQHGLAIRWGCEGDTPQVVRFGQGEVHRLLPWQGHDGTMRGAIDLAMDASEKAAS